MELSERIGSWINVLFKPSKVLREQKSRASYADGFVNVFATVLIQTALQTIFMLAFAGLVFQTFGLPLLWGANYFATYFEKAAFGIGITFLFSLIISLAVTIVVWAGGGWVVFKMSRWLGGKGGLATQLYLNSVLLPGFGVINSLLSLPLLIFFTRLSTVSFFSGGWGFGTLLGLMLTGAASLLVIIYYFYCYILALAETHKLSMGNAAASCILGHLILGAIIGVIVFGIILVSLASFIPLMAR